MPLPVAWSWWINAAKAGRPAAAAANWTFQARVLDAAGKGLTVTQPEGKK